MVWKEEVSRDVARVLMEQYSSVADALFELVDNPVDFRRKGHRIEIDVRVEKDNDLIVVEDHGGAGMDDAGIAEWLRWGAGRRLRASDISRWRVGGKAACGYLANRLVMYAKAAGDARVWFFEDDDWATRAKPGDWGEPSPLPRTVPLPSTLRGRPTEDGYVRIELSQLKPRVCNVEDLRWDLSNIYRSLIERRDVAITINSGAIEPLRLPRSSAFDDVSIDLKTASGHRIRGWVGRLDRDALVGPSTRRRVRGGVRCTYQGRLVREGEYFGHAGDAKGSLASLIGEIELRFVEPNLMKTDFNRGSTTWSEVETCMHEFLAPIIAEFRRAGDKRTYSREERKALANVCSEIAQALKRAQRDEAWPGEESLDNAPPNGRVVQPGGVHVGSGGRLSPQPSAGDGEPATDADREKTNPRRGTRHRSEAPPPDSAVGKLLRMLDRISKGSTIPPAVLDSFDPSLRSAWRTDNGETKLALNTSFPLYEVLGAAPGYLAETIIMEVAKPPEGGSRDVGDYLAEVSQLTAAWARVHLAAT